MTATLRINLHDQTGTIIFNRPDKRNALSRQLLAELEQALDDLHRQKSVRAVILTGAGPAFCAGMDLNEMLETSKSDHAQQQWNEDALVYRDLLEQMLRFPKPLIAAVNGPALAGFLVTGTSGKMRIHTRPARFMWRVMARRAASI